MQTKKKHVDVPLYELTLRRYEKPVGLTKRDMVARVCLSIGLLQPGDSRDVVIDVLYALLLARSQKKELSTIEVRESVVQIRKDYGLALQGVADSNIRRQLLRLRAVFFVEKLKNNYRITEFERLPAIFQSKVEQYIFPQLLSRVKDYLQEVDTHFVTP
jgi:hypothetical protein